MNSSRAIRRGSIDPVVAYLVLNAGQALCFSLFFTVQLVFHVTTVGLSPMQLMLVGTVLEATCFIFETPTGIVADLYSRRRSVLIGIALIGISYLIGGAIATFWAALTSIFIWGVGYTFTSGATEAWLVDEIGEEAAGPVFLRGHQAWLIGVIAGTPLAVVLALIHLQLPMVLAGAGLLALTIGLAFVMTERNWSPTPAEDRSTFGQMRGQLRVGWNLAMARPVVRTILLISIIAGLAAEAFDRFNVPFAIEQFEFPSILGRDDPVIWFGLNGLLATLIGLAASEWFKRRGSLALTGGHPNNLLALCASGKVAALIVFALSGNLLLAFAMFWVRAVIDVVQEPVELAWLNRNLDPSTRATVISMTGQANAIGQASGGPMYGWIGGALSFRAALLVSAAVLAPTIALYQRVRHVKSPETISSND